jgi:hypothetical protein
VSAPPEESGFRAFLQHEDGTWSGVDEYGFAVPIESPDAAALRIAGLIALSDSRVIDVEPLTVRDFEE